MNVRMCVSVCVCAYVIPLSESRAHCHSSVWGQAAAIHFFGMGTRHAKSSRVVSGHLSYWQGDIPQAIVNRTGQTYMGREAVSLRRVAEMGYPGEKKSPRAG